MLAKRESIVPRYSPISLDQRFRRLANCSLPGGIFANGKHLLSISRRTDTVARMSVIEDQNRKRVLDLVEYLIRLAGLRTKTIRDVQDYQDVLWLNDIPRGPKECFTRAWGPDERFDADIWIEIENRKEPPLPKVPPVCEDWVEMASFETRTISPSFCPKLRN